MASFFTLHLHVPSFASNGKFSDELALRPEMVGVCNWKTWNRRARWEKIAVKAMDSDGDRRIPNDAIVIEEKEMDSSVKPRENSVSQLRESAGSVPVFHFSISELSGTKISVGLFILATMLVVVVKHYVTMKSHSRGSGSVADLVRRGQIRSDRRGITTPLKCEDPFNNPMVKVSKNNSTVEMFGKVYRLAPVTLTDEQQNIHQKRRSRAYQWKRPTIFLKEGDSVPPDVDPDTVRWIPANHPFATTSSDIDEDLAQSNVNQKHGVPFRIKAEHDALQRKLEALQNEQKLGKLVIDPATVRDFERAKKLQMKPEEEEESSNPNLKPGAQSNHSTNSIGKSLSSDEVQSP